MCILATLLFLGAVGLAQLVYPQAAQNRGGQNAAPNTNRPDTIAESPNVGEQTKPATKTPNLILVARLLP